MIKSTEEANKTLLNIKELQRKIEIIESKYNAQIDDLKKRINKKTSEDYKLLEELKSDLQIFMKSTPNLFKESKTVKLSFGTLHARKNPAKLTLKEGQSWESVLKNLYENGFEKYIEIKEIPNKSAIKKHMHLEDMDLIGVSKEQETLYSYKIA